MEKQGKFEMLNHQFSETEQQPIPIYVVPREGLVEESRILFHAALLIERNRQLFDGDISKLRDKLGVLITEPDGPGMIIPDKNGAGSVSIDSETTVVSRRERGRWSIPTGLLFDMVYQWAEAEDQQEADQDG